MSWDLAIGVLIGVIVTRLYLLVWRNWMIPVDELCGSCDGKPAPVADCEWCHGTGRELPEPPAAAPVAPEHESAGDPLDVLQPLLNWDRPPAVEKP